MSTYTSEPGTRLAGRYRLVEQADEGAGWTYWKATDETLARSVTVLTFATGFPRVDEAVTAARAASRLNDPRFSQVFDVEDADEAAYVVMEWVVGASLLDMLAEGPLDAPRAAALIAEAARAIASAHAAGLAHLRLDPACLHWTPGGGVKITGLGIDAALTGTTPDEADDDGDGALTDTRGLSRLLYAALTGYWPGYEGQGPGLLPPAPDSDGVPCTPRQVSAGVPAGIDEVTCRALFQRTTKHGSALSTPAEFAEALAAVAPPVPFAVPPASAQAARTSGGRGSVPDWSTGSYPAADDTSPGSRSGGYRGPPRERSSGLRAIAALVIVLVLVAVGVTVYSAVSHSEHHAAVTTPPKQQSSTSPAAPTNVLLTPVGDNSYDALGNDGGNENASDAPFAIDGKASSDWHTDYYIGNPVFGGEKTGTGLIIDMGKSVRLSSVEVQFGTTCCTYAEIEIGNNDTPTPAGLQTFTELASSKTAAGATTFNMTKNTTGRYVLIWITRLPPSAAGQYESLIYNVVVHGSAASQSG